MATRTESRVVYAAGVAQGIVLQYGFLFLPQVIAAIASALLGAGLDSRSRSARALAGAVVISLARQSGREPERRPATITNAAAT